MKRDTRQAILLAGAELIHRQGFNRTGIKEILDLAGVPKGSFYFYFPSKEAFGLALIDHFTEHMGGTARSILFDPGLPPLERLARFFATLREKFSDLHCARGCPIGNLSQEMSDLSPAIQQRVCAAFSGMAGLLARVLGEAAERGELSGGIDPDQAAAFIVDAWEGALLRMKAEKRIDPLLRFEDIIFTRVLR